MKRLVVSREKNSIRFRNRSRIAVTVAVTVTVTTVTELSMLPCKTKEVKIERIVEEEKNLLFLFVSYQRIEGKRWIFICFRWKLDFLLRIIQFIPSRFMIDNNLYREIKIFIL